MRFGTGLCVLFASFLVVAATVQAAAASDAALDAAGWRQFTPPGERPADFTLGHDGAVRVRAEDAVSFLYRPIIGTANGALRLTWRWRVDQAPPASAQDSPGMDDRPLAVHAWFAKPAGDTTFWDRVQDTLGYPVPGHVITYVWGGRGRRGDLLVNPHLDNAVLIMLRDDAASLGVWHREEVDLAADFRRAFGRLPEGPAQYLMISADTDDKGGTAEGAVTDLRLRHDGRAG